METTKYIIMQTIVQELWFPVAKDLVEIHP